MLVEVTLYKAGKLWKESYQATDFQDAREIAKARNPNVTIVGCSASVSKDELPDYFSK